jgi:hypothetical protein
VGGLVAVLPFMIYLPATRWFSLGLPVAFEAVDAESRMAVASRLVDFPASESELLCLELVTVVAGVMFLCAAVDAFFCSVVLMAAGVFTLARGFTAEPNFVQLAVETAKANSTAPISNLCMAFSSFNEFPHRRTCVPKHCRTASAGLLTEAVLTCSVLFEPLQFAYQPLLDRLDSARRRAAIAPERRSERKVRRVGPARRPAR